MIFIDDKSLFFICTAILWIALAVSSYVVHKRIRPKEIGGLLFASAAFFTAVNFFGAVAFGWPYVVADEATGILIGAGFTAIFAITEMAKELKLNKKQKAKPKEK